MVCFNRLPFPTTTSVPWGRMEDDSKLSTQISMLGLPMSHHLALPTDLLASGQIDRKTSWGYGGMRNCRSTQDEPNSKKCSMFFEHMRKLNLFQRTWASAKDLVCISTRLCDGSTLGKPTQMLRKSLQPSGSEPFSHAGSLEPWNLL